MATGTLWTAAVTVYFLAIFPFFSCFLIVSALRKCLPICRRCIFTPVLPLLVHISVCQTIASSIIYETWPIALCSCAIVRRWINSSFVWGQPPLLFTTINQSCFSFYSAVPCRQNLSYKKPNWWCSFLFPVWHSHMRRRKFLLLSIFSACMFLLWILQAFRPEFSLNCSKMSIPPFFLLHFYIFYKERGCWITLFSKLEYI